MHRLPMLNSPDAPGGVAYPGMSTGAAQNVRSIIQLQCFLVFSDKLGGDINEIRAFLERHNVDRHCFIDQIPRLDQSIRRPDADWLHRRFVDCLYLRIKEVIAIDEDQSIE